MEPGGRHHGNRAQCRGPENGGRPEASQNRAGAIEGREHGENELRTVRGIVCSLNSKPAAGTRRVHEPGHARARAGTADKPRRADLQEKRNRKGPVVPANTAAEPPW